MAAGSIHAALSKSLANIGSHLMADELPINKFMPYVWVEEGSRFSQTQLSSGERLFLSDFWSQGVMFGSVSSDSLETIARAIHAWISEKSSIEAMSNLFKPFSATEDGVAHEEGKYIEHKWKKLLESWHSKENPFKIRSRKQLFHFLFSLTLQQKIRHLSGYFQYRQRSKNQKEYSPILIIKAAMKKPALKQLFPYTSLNRLCFSRTTGYPFTHDCPMIEPQGNGRYRVYMPDSQEIIGEGTAGEAVEIAVNHLPSNCGAAVNGTADDFTL
jgi:hypothetical protein